VPVTALVEEPRVGDLRVPLSRAVDLVRSRTGLDVLVEAGDGALLEYAVGTAAPPLVVRALLAKDLSPLRTPVSRLRTVALVPGGPVVTREPGPGLTAVVIPVEQLDGEAWLWLVGRDAHIDGPVARELASLVSAHLPKTDSTFDVEAALSGCAPLPAGWAESSLAVVVVRSGEPAAVVRALRCAGRTHHVPALVGETPGGAVAVAVGADGAWLRSAAAHLVRLQVHARGAYCTGSAGCDVATLRAQAGAAADVSTEVLTGCDDLAARVAVRHAARAVAAAPVSRNAVGALLEHDARRGTDLARTLLVWLDAHSDALEASRRICIHPNTLRYRLRRAGEVLAADLTDPDTRLEIHLRLRLELDAG
jgi:hypothetical protein